jgi:hypothetical protein
MAETCGCGRVNCRPSHQELEMPDCVVSGQRLTVKCRVAGLRQGWLLAKESKGPPARTPFLLQNCPCCVLEASFAKASVVDGNGCASSSAAARAVLMVKKAAPVASVHNRRLDLASESIVERLQQACYSKKQTAIKVNQAKKIWRPLRSWGLGPGEALQSLHTTRKREPH